MTATELGTGAGVRTGNFHGRPTRILENASCWIEVLADRGPWVVRFGLTGGSNVFAETPDLGWDTPFGRVELLGGHRLWFAPERPALIGADAALESPRFAAAPGDATLLRAGIEAASGLRRSMEIRLDAAAAAVSVHHVLMNCGDAPIAVAAWPITQLPLGGVAIVPQPRVDGVHAVTPNRNAVLWPYADWRDERFVLADGLLAVRARPGRAFKAGCRSEAGVTAYLRGEHLFVKRFDPAPGAPHADIDCNAEVYCDERSCELETLGPLVTLDPGAQVAFDEHWSLHRVPALPDGAGAESLLEVLAALA